jgi:uncharacterized protein (TIGR03086 family)
LTELIVLFERATEGFSRHVHAIERQHWHDSTPCTEWDVRMLVNHVVVEQLWVPPIVQGSSVTDVGSRFGGDQLGDDPVGTWQASTSAALAAFSTAGVLEGSVSLSSGVRATSEYCWEMTTDALIHTWDLARSIGAEELLDPELVELVYERILPVAEHLHESGMFAPPVTVPADAGLQTKLLALFGRSS